MNCAQARFVELPDDVWIHVMSFLDTPCDTVSLAMLSQTCCRLDRIVASSTALWPRVFSSFLHASEVERKPGMPPTVTFPSVWHDCEADACEPCTLKLTSAQARSATRALREILPVQCFKEAILEKLDLATSVAMSTPTLYSTSFYRLCGEYNSSLFHKEAMLSIVDDGIDTLFGLADGDIASIQDLTGLDDSHGLPVEYVISTAFGNILSKPRLDPVTSFWHLSNLVKSRQQERDALSSRFRCAAEAEGLVFPTRRRHVSERMYCCGKWRLEYALRFLKISQPALLEEFRETEMQAYIIQKTNLSMSAYSCLSAMFVSGRLSELWQLDDREALKVAVCNLEELDFAYRKTCYYFLKGSLLRSVGSRELCTKETIANHVHEHVRILFDHSLQQYRNDFVGTPTCMEDGDDSSSSASEDENGRGVDDEGMSLDGENIPQNRPDGWCVVENANDGRREGLMVFNVDELWDFSLPAQELRKWSYFLCACSIYARGSGRGENEELVNPCGIPSHIFPVLNQMLSCIRSWMDFFHEKDRYWSMLSNMEFIEAIICNQEFCTSVQASSPGLSGVNIWDLEQSPTQVVKQQSCVQTGNSYDGDSPTAITDGPRHLKRKLSDFLVPVPGGYPK